MRKPFTFLGKAALCMFFLSVSPAIVAQEKIWESEAEYYDDLTDTNIKVTEVAEENCFVSNCHFIENIAPNAFAIYKNINASKEGTYELKIYYTMVDERGRDIGVVVNTQVRDTVSVLEQTGSWDGGYAKDPDTGEIIEGTEGTAVASILIYLEKGSNMLRIGGGGVDYSPNFDKFEIYTSTEVIEKPAYDNSSVFHWDYTDDAIAITGDHLEGISNLIDNNTATFYEVKGVTEASVVFEFEYPMHISGFLISSGVFGEKIDLDMLEIQGSNDLDDWTSGSKVTPEKNQHNTKGPAGQIARTNLYEMGSYKYIRLHYSSSTEDIKIADFQLFGYPGYEEGREYPKSLIDVEILNQGTVDEVAVGLNGIFTTSNPGITGADYIELASRAVDGIRNKFTISGKSMWIQYDFDEETVVGSYSIGAGATGNYERDPKQWILQATPDWGETWEIIDQVDEFKYPNCHYANMKFNVDNPKEYTGYRLEILSNNGSAGNLHVSEIQFFGEQLKAPSSIENNEVNQVADVNVSGGKGVITIENESANIVSYQIYHLTGQLVAASKVVEGSDVSVNVNSGVYVVAVKSANGITSYKVLVK